MNSHLKANNLKQDIVVQIFAPTAYLQLFPVCVNVVVFNMPEVNLFKF